jgi:hypothetical protein
MEARHVEIELRGALRAAIKRIEQLQFGKKTDPTVARLKKVLVETKTSE